MQLQKRVIEGREPGPSLLITGGVHGDEFEPMIAVRRLMARPEWSQLRGTLTLVPVVNEAALARGSRVAEDGLDLARTCPGRADGSITEQAAQALSAMIREADYYIDLHTGGTALSVWPLAGYMLHPNAEVLEKQRLMARAFNLPLIWGTDANLEGRSLSVARDAHVPAIYAEYEGGGRVNPAGIEAYVAGCLNVMAAIGMLDRPPDVSRVEIAVEDPRPSSGHMQRCYPAPATGCFECAVELGQSIRIGEFLGSIVDPLGQERHEVRSMQTGRIIVLRTLAAVHQGDSLAVVLETPEG